MNNGRTNILLFPEADIIYLNDTPFDWGVFDVIKWFVLFTDEDKK